jgi:hypothetical protein
MTGWPPPKQARLITALSRLGDPAIAEQQANIIMPLILAVITPSRGHEIGRDDAGFYYARSRTATAGLARELRDLRGKARKAVAGTLTGEDWIKAWAAVPARTQRLLWRPRLIETAEGRTIDRRTLAGSYSAPGFALIAPKPEVVLPAIAAKLDLIEATPAAQRRKRKRDEHEQAAIAAIRGAYRMLTNKGYKGARSVDPLSGKLAGRLIGLGHEIDRIFGTALFAEKDSRRLR